MSQGCDREEQLRAPKEVRQDAHGLPEVSIRAEVSVNGWAQELFWWLRNLVPAPLCDERFY